MTNPKRENKQFELERIFDKLTDEGYAETLFEDLLEEKTQRTADGILVCCPFHNDNTPSFSISLTNPVYYCFGCGETGNWITYLGKTRGMNFLEAIKFLAMEAGMELSKNFSKKLKEQAMIQEILNEANEFFKAKLTTTKEIDLNGYIEYRGFTSDTIKRFQIGHAPSGGKTLCNHLKGLGYKDEDLLKTGLFTLQDDSIEDFFQGRIMYPYLKYGNPVYFIGGLTNATPSWDIRAKYKKQLVSSSNRKYISPEINNNTFYGEDMILNADAVFITEGITDCITLNQNGYASISPATVKPKVDNIEKLAGLCKDKVVHICNDIESNNAGFNGARDTAQELLKYGIKANIIMLPEPSAIPAFEEDKVDVNEYFKHFSKADFDRLIENSKNIIDMDIENLTQNCDSTFVEKAIKNLPNLKELEQDMYINIIQQKTGYKKAILKRMLDKIKASLQKELEQQEVISEITLTPEEEADAIKKLSSPTLMYEIGQVLERVGIAGEEKNKRSLYLIFMTRIMQSALQPVFKSESAAGKSYLVTKVLKLFPKEEWREIGQITPRTLYYLGENDLQHKILYISEMHGMSETDYPIRIAQSEGVLSIATTIKDPKTGEFIASQKTVPASGLCIVITTTSSAIHPENETRSITLNVDDSQKQRKLIRQMQLREYNTDYKEVTKDELILWQNIQKCIKPYKVIIPYGQELADIFPIDRSRCNRDFKKILSLIEVSALLHQYQRQKRHDENGKECIVASIADLMIVKELFEESLKTTLQELHPNSIRILKIIKKEPDKNWTIPMLRDKVECKDNWIRKYIKSLVEAGYLNEKPIPGLATIYSYACSPAIGNIFPDMKAIQELYRKELKTNPDLLVHSPTTGKKLFGGNTKKM